jgi:hypothetical protein
MNAARTEYLISLTVNGLKIEAVVIDGHYKEKHSPLMDDELILKLVQSLDGEYHDFNDDKHPFKYFVKNEIEIESKLYRLIWLLEENQSYIGVVNAFRSSK